MSEEPKITAAQVKELRDRTGAGMMDCKAALTETGGELVGAGGGGRGGRAASRAEADLPVDGVG